MTTAIKTTGVAHWDYLAVRSEAIKELAEITEKFQAAIDTAINGTPEQKLAVLNSLQSYANNIKYLEGKIYKFKIGQKVVRKNGTRSVGWHGTILARIVGDDNSPIYAVQNEETGKPVRCHEIELTSR